MHARHGYQKGGCLLSTHQHVEGGPTLHQRLRWRRKKPATGNVLVF